MMRIFLICAVGTALLLQAAPAFAFCSKPITPFCASDGDLTGRYVSEANCRKLVKDHLSDLELYRSCRRDEIEQIDQEIERFEDLLGGEPERSQNRHTGPTASVVHRSAEATSARGAE